MIQNPMIHLRESIASYWEASEGPSADAEHSAALDLIDSAEALLTLPAIQLAERAIASIARAYVLVERITTVLRARLPL